MFGIRERLWGEEADSLDFGGVKTIKLWVSFINFVRACFAVLRTRGYEKIGRLVGWDTQNNIVLERWKGNENERNTCFCVCCVFSIFACVLYIRFLEDSNSNSTTGEARRDDKSLRTSNDCFTAINHTKVPGTRAQKPRSMRHRVNGMRRVASCRWCFASEQTHNRNTFKYSVRRLWRKTFNTTWI